MNNKFIYTQDKEFADKLINLGYHLIQEDKNTNFYIFENNKSINFNLDNNKFKYIINDTLFF